MFGALLYIKEPVTLANLVAAGHEFATTHHVKVHELPPEDQQINLAFDEIPEDPILCDLIRQGHPASWRLNAAEEEGVPFHPEAILTVSVPMARGREALSFRYASEVVGFFVEHWTAVLYSDLEDRLYTRDEVLANSREGIFPY